MKENVVRLVDTALTSRKSEEGVKALQLDTPFYLDRELEVMLGNVSLRELYLLDTIVTWMIRVRTSMELERVKDKTDA